MENISKTPQEAGTMTVPARLADITLVGEFQKTAEAYTAIRDCLNRVNHSASDSEINAEVEVGVEYVNQLIENARSTIQKIWQMPGMPESEHTMAQRTRLADLDYFLANPGQALTRHMNIALAAMAAGAARVAAAWATAGVMSVSPLDRLRMTSDLLLPQIKHLQARVDRRHDELAETHSGLDIASSNIRLTGMDVGKTVWRIVGGAAKG